MSPLSALMESNSRAFVSNLAQLHRLYNTYAAKYFPEDMPRAGVDVTIVASPLQVQQRIGESWFEGMDANGMVTSTANGPIILMVNPFFNRYPRLMAMTMAHEMVHAYCHWQFKKTKDLRWLDNHGERFHKVTADLIGKGLVGVKPSQDLVELPHSYPVLKGHAKKGGYFFLRLDGYDELTENIVNQFRDKCDADAPYYIGEMRNSVVSIFPFVIEDRIVGEFFAYGDDSVLKLNQEKAYKFRR